MKHDCDHIPLAPRRYPFFYGWFIVALSAFGFLMSTPGQTYGVSPFTDALIEALGLTRVQLSLAYMIGTIGSALCLTYAGRAYDRFGARVVGPAASLLLGVVLLFLSQCDRMVDRVTATLGLASGHVVGFVTILLLFFALRFSGQGVLTMVSNNMRVKWFDRHRGFVTGLSGMVIAPAFSATPAVFHALVEAVGWRGAWIRLALLVGGLFTVIAALFFRDNPEDCGLRPDGPLADKSWGRPKPPAGGQRQYTLAEARRTYRFWVFALGIALFGFYVTGMSFHAASIFESAGMERNRGYMIFLYASIVSVALRPIVGWLSDRIPLKFLMMALMVGICMSTLGLRILAEGLSMWMVIAGNGIAGATLGTLGSITWPNFFGREHLGAISGFNMSITVFASAIGPWLFSQCLAHTDTYSLALLGTTALAAALLLLATRADDFTARSS
ncbi:MAG: MFS transporter [Kiritimatiellia bacterium]|jgi:MFS family permease|nr:MFS transporter [Kiritimatiellia bacterium]MDP6631218.1 MFS transporter [Kiritimatiellia bacterium]MDP6809549.1 MFS transporter [Kiritimatiellia bacterium]MDP7023600.1 MFS transporter [Kiritimatiellia bacterium]